MARGPTPISAYRATQEQAGRGQEDLPAAAEPVREGEGDQTAADTSAQTRSSVSRLP